MKFEEARIQLREKCQNPILLFLVVVSSQLIDHLNIGGFLTSLEQIQSHYDVSFALASWSLSAYSVTFASFIMFFGRLSDIVGYHLIYTYGLLWLGIVSVIAAAVDDIYVLIVFRALQGIGAAATIPPSFAIVAHSFHGDSLKIAIGCLTTALIVVLGVALILGGAFSATDIGYKGILWISAGVSLITSFLSFISVEPAKDTEKAGSLRNLDYFGFFLFITGAVLLVTGFTEAGESWKRPRAYVPIIVGVLLIVSFLLWEIFFFNGERGQSIDLLIPKQMWQITNFKSIPIVAFFSYAAYFGCFLVTANYLQEIAEDSPVMTGVKVAIPQNVASVSLVILLSTVLLHKMTPKFYCFIGIVIAFVGTILLTRMPDTDIYWRYTMPGVALFAGGTGTYFIRYLSLIMIATPLEMQGLISGICQTMGQFGTAVIFAGDTSIIGNSNDSTGSKKELAKSYQNSLYLSLACYGVCLLMILIFVKDLRPEDEKHKGNDGIDDVATDCVKDSESSL